MQISRLQIKNLYDQYNYDIDFNSEEKEQITILTGPNGYGKTTILRILKSLNPKSLYYFYVIKFSEIIINSSLKFEIMARQLSYASQRVL